MAFATSSENDPPPRYVLPGGRAVSSFVEMNNYYMAQHFAGWNQGKSFVVPALPPHAYPEPLEGVSGGAKAELTSQDEYARVRTVQKSERDERGLYRMLQKIATETGRVMFVFFGFKLNKPELDSLRVVISEFTSEGDDADGELKGVLGVDKKGQLRNIEIDVIVVDRDAGVAVLEMKGRDANLQVDDAASSNALARIGHAQTQQRKDVRFLRFLYRRLCGPVNGELAIKTISTLTDDDSSGTDAKPVIFERDMADFDSFRACWERLFPLPKSGVEENREIFAKLVPTLVGLKAAFSAVGLRKGKNGSTGDKPSLMFVDVADFDERVLLANRDEKVNKQVLSSTHGAANKSAITDVVFMEKTSAFRSSKHIQIVYLTPEQNEAFVDKPHVCILEGPAGAGKTIVLMFKLLFEVSEGDGNVALLLCRGSFLWEYHRFLDANGIRAKTYISKQKVADEEKHANLIEHLLQVEDTGAPNECVLSVSVAQMKADGVDVALCDILDFANAAAAMRNRRRMQRQIDAKRKGTSRAEILAIQVTMTWKQTLHVFIDDADFRYFTDWSSILSAMDPAFITCIAFDHTQTMGRSWSFDLDDDATNASALSAATLQKFIVDLHCGKWIKLTGVLRNAEEIVRLNCALAKQILRVHNNVYGGVPLPKPGHSIVAGPVHVLELYDKCFWSNTDDAHVQAAALVDFSPMRSRMSA